MREHAPAAHSVQSDAPQPLCAVLVLAYKRRQNVIDLVVQAAAQGVGQVFVSIDGPRAGEVSPFEEGFEATLRQRCPHVQIRVRRLPRNLGCKRAVSSAITWFFSHVECGVIVEEDVKVARAFFSYATAMLREHEGDRRIGAICARSPLNLTNLAPVATSFFHCWGWATWRNRWEAWDGRGATMFLPWNVLAVLRVCRSRLRPTCYFLRVAAHVATGRSHSWAYPMMFAMWRNKWKCVLPPHNMQQNVGFDRLATSTTIPDHRAVEVITDMPASCLAVDFSRLEAVDEYTLREDYRVW